MDEFNGLYTAVIQDGSKEIHKNLAKIPHVHKQEAINHALQKAITLTRKPKMTNIKYLLDLDANPNGPDGNEGFILSYAYTAGLYDIVELLLDAGADVNALHSDVLEQAIRKGDIRYVVRFVELGADINDTSKLLFSNDLLSAAKDYPEIQKYLLRKGITSKSATLNSKLKNIITPVMNDFEYPTVNGEKVCVVNLKTVDFSDKFFIISGDTSAHQDLLRSFGAKYVKGKWYVSTNKREAVDAAITKLCKKTVQPNESEKSAESEESLDDEYIKKVLRGGTIKRPSIEKRDCIELYTPSGEYGYLTISYQHENLFHMDSQVWDSVERYLMYKKYEGTAKARAIKDATTLKDARKKFNVKSIPVAKTPRQLVINQKLQPLAKSEVSRHFLQNKEKIFNDANRAKFLQNQILKNRLLKTGDKYIINKNTHDCFGYEGNCLGNILLHLREEFGGKAFNKNYSKKTNNMILEKYNDNFQVIRGDPDQNLASKIRDLGTFRAKNGKMIKGKLNLNLNGGPGWLIPASKHDEAIQLIFDTMPEEKQIEIIGREWINKQLQKYLDTAIIFTKFRGKQEISSFDILFTVKDVYGEEEYLGLDTDNVADHFVQTIWEYMNTKNFTISDSAITLLWNFLSKMVSNMTVGIETFSQMEQVIHNHENKVLNTSINCLGNLTERESIVISSFIRLYNLMKKMHDKEAKVSVCIIHIMLGKDHYEKIRQKYSKKARIKGEKYNDEDEEVLYKRRFKIKSPHVDTILTFIPQLSKKCKLLLLTTLDYVMDLEDADAISASKKLIQLSHKGRIATPTPAELPTPIDSKSDIPKTSEYSESKRQEKSDRSEHRSETKSEKSEQKSETKSEKSEQKSETKSEESEHTPEHRSETKSDSSQSEKSSKSDSSDSKSDIKDIKHYGTNSEESSSE